MTLTAYEGDVGFAQYRVLRNVPDQTQMDTLAVIDEAGRLAFTDTTLSPGSVYSYRVAVVNVAGFEAVSSRKDTRHLSLPAVQIQDLRLNSRTASETRVWTRHRGTRFRAYQILRRVPGQTEKLGSRRQRA